MDHRTPPSIAVSVELPASFLDLVGPVDDLARRMRRALIMDLLFDNVISQGKAAELLGISVGEMMDLIANVQSRQYGLTAEEILDDLRHLEAAHHERSARAGD